MRPRCRARSRITKALTLNRRRADSSRVSVIRLRALRSEEHTSELQSPCNLVCRLLLEKKKKIREQSRLRDDVEEQVLVANVGVGLFERDDALDTPARRQRIMLGLGGHGVGDIVLSLRC